MSLHTAAQHLASKGRDGDSTLVHMSPGEVQSLQTIAKAHGGSLTINPDTGLAEAGFLKNILPAIAGAGLMMIPGMQTWGAGLIVGGAEALRTGDIGRGLTAGLGAYGGAGLGSAAGLGSSGTPVIPGDTAGFVKPAGSDLNVLANEVTNPVSTSASAIGKNALMAAAPVVNDAMTIKPVDAVAPEKSSGKYLAGDFEGYEPRRPQPYYSPQGLGYTGYAAQGGMMPNDLRYADGGMVDPMQRMPNGGLAAIQGMRDGYGATQTVDGNIPQMADGGSIGGYSDGGRMLKGPGDGMSDSIPGVIGNKQPARLADGEFVVPADVVSHLGNGSTDAGAKRLYSMMDKVRKARTGTKKQGKQIKPQKFMPA